MTAPARRIALAAGLAAALAAGAASAQAAQEDGEALRPRVNRAERGYVQEPAVQEPARPAPLGAATQEAAEAGGTGALADPPIGSRPSPAEAAGKSDAKRGIMRPPEGSASGGVPDAPLSR